MPKHEKLNITNNIRTLRFFAGEMTQQQLAEKAGVSRQTVLAIEAGKYSPSLELAFRIAGVFGVEIGEVFAVQKDDEEIQPPSKKKARGNGSTE